MKRKIHIIACGGTALTLLDVKASTKDVDFMIPVASEYEYLIKNLEQLGYEQITASRWKKKTELYTFDLFMGKSIHTTELLKSPLDSGNSILIKELSYIYLGVLNYYDIIISKLIRGTGADFEDCLSLVMAKKKEIDLDLLKSRFLKTTMYDVSEERIKRNLNVFLEIIKKEGLYG